MNAVGRFLLAHPWAFVGMIGVVVASVVGIVALGAWLLVPPAPEEDPRAAALRSLREMHPGPRAIP